MSVVAQSNLKSWVLYLRDKPLPVLRRTTRELARLREHEDSISARALAHVILQDPMMTLRVLAFIQLKRGRSQHTDITTIERALMMIGITPFFNSFDELPILEDHLHKYPQALLGVMRVIGRARHASKWAREWALMRHDTDVDEITVAALLHDLAEIICWIFAPELSLQLRDLLLSRVGVRSAAAQRQVFNVSAHELQLALAQEWRLPELLIQLMDDAQEQSPRVRTVALAVNLARHSSRGWHDAALPDDFRAICELLHISHESLFARLGLPTDGSVPLNATTPSDPLPEEE